MTLRHFKDIISDILQSKKVKEAMLMQKQFENQEKSIVHPMKREKNSLPALRNRYFT